MAVVNIREVYPGVSLGLWQMDETVEQLFEAYPLLQAYRSQMEEKYKNDGRKLEFLAIRALMYEMLKDEKAEDLDAKLVHWCAKETVFKLFSEENLMFEDMRVKPFDTMVDWSCDVENLKSRKTAHVDFELTMEFVLTYAAL